MPSDALLVAEFTTATGHPVPDKPIKMEEPAVNFLIKMVLDELMELCQSVYEPAEAKEHMINMIKDSKDLPKLTDTDPMEIAASQVDALTDVYIYMLNGAAKHGMNISKVFKLVHNANMDKKDPITNKFIKREDGKILKRTGWQPPDITAEMHRQLKEGSWSDDKICTTVVTNGNKVPIYDEDPYVDGFGHISDLQERYVTARSKGCDDIILNHYENEIVEILGEIHKQQPQLPLPLPLPLPNINKTITSSSAAATTLPDGMHHFCGQCGTDCQYDECEDCGLTEAEAESDVSRDKVKLVKTCINGYWTKRPAAASSSINTGYVEDMISRSVGCQDEECRKDYEGEIAYMRGMIEEDEFEERCKLAAEYTSHTYD